MNGALHVAQGLSIPPELITRKTSILAKSGAGKSYTLRKVFEQIVEHLAGRACGVLIDPLGVMYGLRFGADGKSAGLSIPILGGSHGDVPLAATSGPLAARVVLDGNAFAVVDISGLDEEEQWEFMRSFVRAATASLAERRQPFLLAIDEADLFAPETPAKGQSECQRALRHYCRRVRNFGGGYIFSTQSTSVIDKKVVGQSDLIIAMQITSPTDQKPIVDWLKAGLGEPEAKRIVRTLAALKQGDAWFYSPEWLRLTEQHHILRCDTFDSSKTPEIGEVIETVGRGAAINLDLLREHFKTAEEEGAEAAAIDSHMRELEAQIDELQRELDDARRSSPEPVRVEVPVLSDVDRQSLHACMERVGKAAEAMVLDLDGIRETLGVIEGRIDAGALASQAEPESAYLHRPERREPRAPKPARAASEAPPATDGSLRKGERRILATLAQFHPRPLTRSQVGALSGFTPSGGTFQTYVSTLRRQNLAEVVGDTLRLVSVDAAREILGAIPPRPRTLPALVELWRKPLRAGENKMLDAVIASHPNAISRDELAREVAMEPTGGTFQTYLSTLRRNGLVKVNGAGISAALGDLLR